MSVSLFTVEIRLENDVVLARQRARMVAAAIGFDVQDQTRIATAVSEIARNTFEYGGGAGQSSELRVEPTRCWSLPFATRGRESLNWTTC